ncbi:uncharacterized protein LOC141665159 [Apium graveolens]|uniref:uncharacterized protein LOC141665159 n=1 Tax=Apium graveolens TaxID=4045 RepID=UPI003D7BFE6D
MRRWVLSDAHKDLLHSIGFGVFANPGVVLQNDTRLVTSLVEMWRPETNTFFMRQGEMTVTLEDVGYILGLLVVGHPLVGDGLDSALGYFARHWFEPLDEEEVKVAWARAGIKYTWLYQIYGTVDPGPDPRRIAIHTQAYLLMVIGSVLFPSSSRNVVQPKDSYPATEFWARPVDEVVAGEEEVEEEAEEEPKGKNGKKGKEVKGKQGKEVRGKKVTEVKERKQAIGRRDSRLVPHHSLPHYRCEFDGVAADIVAWTPYAHFQEVEEDSDGDHDISTEDWEALYFGLARIPVLCYDVVEYQHFDSVMRQFRFRQGIPRSPVNMTEYRKPIIPFNPYDWRGVWFAEIGDWTRFSQHLEVVVARQPYSVDDKGNM